jgi:hypothetical protein
MCVGVVRGESTVGVPLRRLFRYEWMDVSTASCRRTTEVVSWLYLRSEYLHGPVLLTAASVLRSTLRLVVISVIFRILILRPSPFPLLQPYWRPRAGRLGVVKITELARAILEI